MQQPSANTPDDEALRQYAASLWARIPDGDLAAAAAAHRARGVPAGSATPADASAHRMPSAPPMAPATQPGARQRPDHVVLGLGVLSKAWPPTQVEALDRFADFLLGIDVIWGRPGSGSALERAVRAPLADRRDEAVRLASVLFYSRCRSSGIDDDAIEEGAQELAGWLGERLYGSAKMVFAPKRGRFVEELQELVALDSGSPAHAAGIRGLSFGTRREGGAIARRALVERIPSGGASP